MSEILEIVDMEKALDIMDGDKELLKECFNNFVNSYPDMLAGIKEAIDAGDASRLETSSHKFKGSLLYLAAVSATDIAAQLERMGREGNLSGSKETFLFLEKECEKLKKFYDAV